MNQKQLDVPKQYKDWIDNVSYESMLRRWRFTPIGESSPWFHGDIGTYYIQIMLDKRNADQFGAIHASKRVGCVT